jgi:hypothetical protein
MPMDLGCQANDPIGQGMIKQHGSASVAFRGARPSSVLKASKDLGFLKRCRRLTGQTAFVSENK